MLYPLSYEGSLPRERCVTLPANLTLTTGVRR